MQTQTHKGCALPPLELSFISDLNSVIFIHVSDWKIDICEIGWFKVRRHFRPLLNSLNCWMTTKINICGCHVMGTCGKNCRQSSHVSYAMHPRHLTTASEQGGHFSSFTHFYDSFLVWVTVWCWWFSEQCMRKVKKTINPMPGTIFFS